MHRRTPFRVTAIRSYATRRPEKPPMRRPDPLLNAPNAKVEILPNNMTFIHRPPPTAPSPFSTTLAPASPLLAPRSTPAPTSTSSSLSSSSSSSAHMHGVLSSEASVPPLSRPPRLFPAERTLRQSDVDEMRRLRASDPNTYTRGKLSKMYNCSPFFVGQQCGLDGQQRKTALEAREKEHDRRRAQWGDRKATFMAIRKKRRSLW